MLCLPRFAAERPVSEFLVGVGLGVKFGASRIRVFAQVAMLFFPHLWALGEGHMGFVFISRRGYSGK